MTIEKAPPYFEREPLTLVAYELPKLHAVYSGSCSLCEHGDLEWPKPILSLLSKTVVAAYRPSSPSSVPFDLALDLLTSWSSPHVPVRTPRHYAIFWPEWVVYAFARLHIVQEASS